MLRTDEGGRVSAIQPVGSTPLLQDSSDGALLQRIRRLQTAERFVCSARAGRPGARPGDGHDGLAARIESPRQACAAVPVAADAGANPMLGSEAGPRTLSLMPSLLRHGPGAVRVKQVCVAGRWVVEPAAPRGNSRRCRRGLSTRCGCCSGCGEHAQQYQAPRTRGVFEKLNHGCGEVSHGTSLWSQWTVRARPLMLISIHPSNSLHRSARHRTAPCPKLS